MSEWYIAESEDIDLSDDKKYIDIYVKTNDFGNVYVQVLVENITALLKKEQLL